MMDQAILRAVVGAALACAAWGQQRPAPALEFRAPAGERTAARRVGAESILPGGRMIEPLGRQYATGPGAFGLAVSPDGKYAVTADGGPDRYSLTVLDMTQDQWRLSRLDAKRRNEKAAPGDDDDWRSVFLGLAWEDGTKLFASEGNSGRVRHVAIPSGRLLGHFHLNDGDWKDSYASDIAYDGERKILYVADQANFRVAVFNARTRKLLASVKAGRLPFKLALSPDRKRLYVANSHRPRPVIMAYPLDASGAIGTGTVLFDATPLFGDRPGHGGVPDGLKVDERGNLWATGPGGVLILSPEGRLLGRLLPGHTTANCAWGDDGRTLYLTSDSILARVRTRVAGPLR